MPNIISDRTLAVLKVIKAAKSTGIGAEAIAKATHTEMEQVRNSIKNLKMANKIAGLLDGVNKGQLYVVKEFAPRKGHLPYQSVSVMAITKAQPRNTQTSPERLAVERLLMDSPEALRPDVISTHTKVEVSKVRSLLQVLRQNGFAANTGTTLDPRWKACAHVAADREASRAKSGARMANGTQPAAPANFLPSMACARPGADDHRLIPSREGNQFKAYRAPASMVSA